LTPKFLNTRTFLHCLTKGNAGGFFVLPATYSPRRRESTNSIQRKNSKGGEADMAAPPLLRCLERCLKGRFRKCSRATGCRPRGGTAPRRP
jgi:hypothetical protein